MGNFARRNRLLMALAASFALHGLLLAFWPSRPPKVSPEHSLQIQMMNAVNAEEKHEQPSTRAAKTPAREKNENIQPAAEKTSVSPLAESKETAQPAPNSVHNAEESLVTGVSYLSHPAPDYPTPARRMGWEGEVLLKVLVGTRGAPAEIMIEKSSSHDELDEAARLAVEKWTFSPARKGSVPVEAWIRIPVKFRLN